MKTSRLRAVLTFLLLALGIATMSARTASADLPFPANYYESQPLWSCTYSTHNWDWEPEPVRYEPDNGSGFVAQNVTLSACWEAISDAIIRNEQRRPTGTVSVVSQGPDTAECVSISFPVPLTQFRCFAAYGVIMDVRYSHGVVEHVWRRGSAFAILGVPQNYIIRLSPAFGSAESGTILTSIEPDKSTNLIAKVYDQNNQLVPNVGVRLTLEAKQNSGGHHHGDDTVVARTGMLAGQQVLTGNTGPNGQGFSFTYNAPSVSGDIDILATCTGGKNCTPQGPKQVWVGVKDLIPLPGLDVYVLLPNVNDPKHPDNHYMTYTAMLRITALAVLYHGQFPDDPLLHLNDASLERGGLFDYKAKDGAAWNPPHETHREGIHIDVRANPDINPDTAISIKNFKDFVDIAKKTGGIARLHNTGTSTQHFHVRF